AWAGLWGRGCWASRCRERSGPSGVVAGAQRSDGRRLAQLRERLRLDLPYALARHGQGAADLLQGVVRALPDAEAHPQDAQLAGLELGEGGAGLVPHPAVDHHVGRILGGEVLDRLAERAVVVVTCGGLERDGVARDLGAEPQQALDPLGRDAQALRELLGRGLAAELV